MSMPDSVPPQRMPHASGASPRHYCFGLIHGAWHTGESWTPLQKELALRGHASVAPDLLAESATATLDDDASAVVSALEDERDIVLVGHSRGGDVVPHVVSRLALDRLVAVVLLNHGGPRDFEPDETGQPSQRYTSEFLSAIEMHPTDDRLTVFRADRAREVFYNDVREADVVIRAIAALRPQRLLPEPGPSAPPLPVELPVYVVRSDSDRVFREGRIERIARDVYNTEPITVAGDHTPQLSRPAALAETLITIAAMAGRYHDS